MEPLSASTTKGNSVDTLPDKPAQRIPRPKPPPGAKLSDQHLAIGAADMAVLETKEREDMDAHVEALRGLCRTARAEAMRQLEGTA